MYVSCAYSGDLASVDGNRFFPCLFKTIGSPSLHKSNQVKQSVPAPGHCETFTNGNHFPRGHHDDDRASSCCNRSWAAISIALCRHSAARYTHAINPERCKRRKSPNTNPYLAFVSSVAPSVRPRCHEPYSSHERLSR